jgi:hypothetical protein
MEYMTTYGWALLLIAVVAVLLYFYIAVPSTIVPSRCAFVIGASCNDMVFGTSPSHATEIGLFLSNNQPYALLNPTLIASINGRNYTFANDCKPGYIPAGGEIICILPLPISSSLNQFFTGSFYLTANYCGLATNTSSKSSCSSAPSQVYKGAFTAHAEPLISPGYNVTLSVENSTNPADGARDLLTARAYMLGYPVSGAEISFYANFTNGTSAVPPYVINPANSTTGTSGVAQSVIYGYKAALVNVTADYFGKTATKQIKFSAVTTSAFAVCTNNMMHSGNTVIVVDGTAYTCSQITNKPPLFSCNSTNPFTFTKYLYISPGIRAVFNYVDINGVKYPSPSGTITVYNCTKPIVIANYSDQYEFNEYANPTYNYSADGGEVNATLLYGAVPYNLTVTPAGATMYYHYQAWFDAGTQIKISEQANPSPAPGWVLHSWTCGIDTYNSSATCYSGTTSTETISMHGAINETANFWANLQMLVYPSKPNQLSTGGTTTPSGITSYPYGTAVQITAKGYPGFEFHEWQGTNPNSFTGTTNPVTIDMYNPITENAIFYLNLTMVVFPSTAANPTLPGNVIPSVGIHNYPYGTVVPINVSSVNTTISYSLPNDKTSTTAATYSFAQEQAVTHTTVGQNPAKAYPVKSIDIFAPSTTTSTSTSTTTTTINYLGADCEEFEPGSVTAGNYIETASLIGSYTGNYVTLCTSAVSYGGTDNGGINGGPAQYLTGGPQNAGQNLPGVNESENSSIYAGSGGKSTGICKLTMNVDGSSDAATLCGVAYPLLGTSDTSTSGYPEYLLLSEQGNGGATYDAQSINFESPYYGGSNTFVLLFTSTPESADNVGPQSATISVPSECSLLGGITIYPPPPPPPPAYGLNASTSEYQCNFPAYNSIEGNVNYPFTVNDPNEAQWEFNLYQLLGVPEKYTPPTTTSTISTTSTSTTSTIPTTTSTSTTTTTTTTTTVFTTTTIPPAPNDYIFHNWTCSGTACYQGPDGSNSVTMYTPITEQANFNVSVVTIANQTTYGTVTPATGFYRPGTTITLDAVPKPGYTFHNWTCTGIGCYSGTSNSIKLTVGDYPITEQANFWINVTVYIDPSPAGATSPVVGTHAYPYGAKVTLNVTHTNPGYQAEYWTCNGGGCYNGSIMVKKTTTTSTGCTIDCTGTTVTKILLCYPPATTTNCGPSDTSDCGYSQSGCNAFQRSKGCFQCGSYKETSTTYSCPSGTTACGSGCGSGSTPDCESSTSSTSYSQPVITVDDPMNETAVFYVGLTLNSDPSYGGTTTPYSGTRYYPEYSVVSNINANSNVTSNATWSFEGWKCSSYYPQGCNSTSDGALMTSDWDQFAQGQGVFFIVGEYPYNETANFVSYTLYYLGGEEYSNGSFLYHTKAVNYASFNYYLGSLTGWNSTTPIFGPNGPNGLNSAGNQITGEAGASVAHMGCAAYSPAGGLVPWVFCAGGDNATIGGYYQVYSAPLTPHGISPVASSTSNDYPTDLDGGGWVVQVPTGNNTLSRPTTRWGCAIDSQTGTMYCLGGIRVGGCKEFFGYITVSCVYNHLDYAGVYNSGGGTTAWTDANVNYPLKNFIDNEPLIAYKGYLYVIGGESGASSCSGGFPGDNCMTRAVYSAEISSGVGSWTLQSNYYPLYLAKDSCVAAHGYIYCIGGQVAQGCNGLPCGYRQVYSAPVSNGVVGSWTQQASYPAPTSSNSQGVWGTSCVSYNVNDLYNGTYEYTIITCVGGEDYTVGAYNAVYSSIAYNGTINGWYSQPNYPFNVTDGQAVLAETGGPGLECYHC